MDSISATVMLKALDGLALRHAAAAQNIANAGTPNYRPVQVSFESALKAARADASAARSVEPKIELQPLSSFGPQMRLDLETATASTTAGRYGAVVEILNRQLQINALAISGGR